jgi:hypothetical protein
MAPDTVYRRRSDTRYRNVAGEGVVVQQTSGEVLVLNEIGAQVITFVEKGMTVDAMVDALGQEYEADAATLEHDVVAYLDELIAAGIIEPVASAPAR